MKDYLTLEVHNLVVPVLTGVYSEETLLPQDLRIDISVELKLPDYFHPDTPLTESKNYMDLKEAATLSLPQGLHFTLIEAVADHIIAHLFANDANNAIISATVKIVKLAIADKDEAIGITLKRIRPQNCGN